MVILGFNEAATTRHDMKLTKENCWRWIVFVCKVYTVAVPVAVLVSPLIGYVIQHFELPDAHLVSYWEGRLQARIIAEESAMKFRFIEYGYVLCFATLLLDAILAAMVRKKNGLRSALFFTVLVVILFAFFYPVTLIVKTK